MNPQVFFRNRNIFFGDLFLIVTSIVGSFVLRLGFGPLLVDHAPRAYVMIVVSLLIKPLVYYAFGLYRRVWVYASIQELKLVGVAVTTASLLVFMVIATLQIFPVFPGFSRYVIFIDWLASLVTVGGLRFAARIIVESQPTVIGSSFLAGSRHGGRKVIIVGAGDAGVMAVREMQKSARSSNPAAPHLIPVCYLDDDPSKQKQEILGVRVVGALAQLPLAFKKYQADEVIIAIPSAPGPVIRSVATLCRANNIPFRTLPSLPELLGGKLNVSQLREVDITDLLRRQTIHLDDELVGRNLTNRRVLVTGAGGSIGSELCRQIARWRPGELVLLGHGENSIFEIFTEMQEAYPDIPIYAEIGDIRHMERMRQLFNRHQPEVVFHAAAHKHVGLMEINMQEAVTNNILGTRNLVELAIQSGVDRLVMISSDKAVHPTSIMGATKRVAEMIVLNAAERANKSFTVVRFGNVLGSRGSIVPRFKRQIANGGPVTITDPQMKRFFMTIPEAVHLVLQAAAMGSSPSTFVLKMGEQIRIVELAEDLIRLSGLEPGKDIEIVFTGAKPGEKLSEELWEEGTLPTPTKHPDVLAVDETRIYQSADLSEAVNELIRCAEAGQADEIVKLLRKLIPGSTIHSVQATDV